MTTLNFEKVKMNPRDMAENQKILEIQVGSHLYGTQTPQSDLDCAGVFLPTIEYVLGFQRVEEVDLSIKNKDELGKNTQQAVDRKLYEFRKFVKLAMENNPNILEQLFVNEPNIVFINEIGQALLAKKHLFPHRGLFDKFKGYAVSQKHKMIIRTDKFHELQNALDYLKDYAGQKEILVEFKDKFLPFMKFTEDFCTIGDLNLQKSLQVKRAVGMIEERLSMVSNRKDLITQHGFDTKFAANLIRLLLEGRELLSQGEITFPLAYRDTILAIKQGKWSIKQVLDYAEQLEAEMEAIVVKSPLPGKPRFAELEAFTINILGKHIYQDYMAISHAA
jgi:predicted nucleotidyltransferase